MKLYRKSLAVILCSVAIGLFWGTSAYAEKQPLLKLTIQNDTACHAEYKGKYWTDGENFKGAKNFGGKGGVVISAEQASYLGVYYEIKLDKKYVGGCQVETSGKSETLEFSCQDLQRKSDKSKYVVHIEKLGSWTDGTFIVRTCR